MADGHDALVFRRAGRGADGGGTARGRLRTARRAAAGLSRADAPTLPSVVVIVTQPNVLQLRVAPLSRVLLCWGLTMRRVDLGRGRRVCHAPAIEE